jgi:hypothetical protein
MAPRYSGKQRKAFRKQPSHKRRLGMRKHQICRQRLSSWSPTATGKWRFIVILKPLFKQQLVCRLWQSAGDSL